MLTDSIKSLIQDYLQAQKIYAKLSSSDNKTEKYKKLIQQRLLLTLEQIESQITKEEQQLALQALKITSFISEKSSIQGKKAENLNKQTPVFSTANKPDLSELNNEVYASPNFKSSYLCYEIEPGTEKLLFSQKRKLLTWQNGTYSPINLSRSEKVKKFQQWYSTATFLPSSFKTAVQVPDYLDPAEWSFLSSAQQKLEAEQCGEKRFGIFLKEVEYFIDKDIMLGVSCDEKTKDAAWEFVWRFDLLPNERQRIREKLCPREISKNSKAPDIVPRGLTILEQFENLLEEKKLSIPNYGQDKNKKLNIIMQVKNSMASLEKSLFAANYELKTNSELLFSFLKNMATMHEQLKIIFFDNEKLILDETVELFKVTFLAKARCRNLEFWQKLQEKKKQLISYGENAIVDLKTKVDLAIGKIDSLEELATESPLDKEKLRNLVKGIRETIVGYSGLEIMVNDYLSSMCDTFLELKKELLSIDTTPVNSSVKNASFNFSFANFSPSAGINSGSKKKEVAQLLIEKLAACLDNNSFIEKNLSELIGKYSLNFPDNQLAIKCQQFLEHHKISCQFERSKELSGGLVKVPAKITFSLHEDLLIKLLRAIPTSPVFRGSLQEGTKFPTTSLQPFTSLGCSQ
ncbi:TPA: FlxA-like family protein [Legionella pneumophila]|nr:FlxA-like family protein [Legionella pneumophila]